MNKNTKIGITLAFATAVISGLANFVNKWGVMAVNEPFVYTTMKNLVTVLLLFGVIYLAKNWRNMKSIAKKDWIKLVFIGLIGGCIPFLLFFWGLKLTSPASASFIHKTLFIWVAFMAIPFLKERFRIYQYGALVFLFLGNLALTGYSSWQWGLGETLAFVATLMWAGEFIISKRVLKRISPNVVAWSRMTFGSVFLLVFLIASGRMDVLLAQGWGQWQWALLTGGILLGFVLTWYHALARVPATMATSILVLASPITTLLNGMFAGKGYTVQQGIGSLILLAGAILIIILLKKNVPTAAKSTA